MKQLTFSRLLLLSLVFSGILLNSCNQDKNPGPSYKYYLAEEHKFDITTTQAKANLLTFQSVFPQSSLLGSVVQSDVQVEAMTYKTTFQDKNIQASGLVCLPKTPGDYPILCFQNGTNTLHSDAPTENPQYQLFQIMESVASMGFIVVMPDYIGFGASAQLPHPYLHAASTVQSILDLLRAVKEYTAGGQVDAKATNDLFIFGYSQGGWATMELQKAIEFDYANEFHLKASSCGAGPYSLEYMNQYITSQQVYPQPYFLAYLLNAYTSLKLVTNPLSDFVQEPYAGKIPGLFDGMHSGDAINAQLTDTIANLLTTEYRTEYETNPKFSEIRSAFLANSVIAWNVSTPTHLYHAANDAYIPPGLSQKMYQDFLATGASTDKVTITTVPGFDHPTGVIPVGILTIIWFLSLK